MKVVSISLVVFLVGLFFADQKLHLFSTVNQTFGQLIQNTTDITTKFLSGAYGVELANAVGTAPYQNVNSDVYISGNTGIGINSPATLLQVNGTTDTSLTTHGLFVLGPTNSSNISIDQNEIMARNNGAVSPLYLNNEGGGVVVGNGGLTVNGTVTATTFSGNLSGTATTAQNANKLIDKNWYWSGQGGQPSWLWGGSDGTNMYVYNPSNFSVNYSTSAGNADTVDYQHLGTGNAPTFAGLTVNGTLSASGAVTVASLNSHLVRRQGGGEGGEIDFEGGEGYTNWQMDTLNGNFRLWNNDPRNNTFDIWNGTGYSTSLTTDGTASDYAETVPITERVEKGDILISNPDANNNIFTTSKATKEYDNRIIGVVSTRAGITLAVGGTSKAKGGKTVIGEYSDQYWEEHPELAPLALAGRVPVKVVGTKNSAIAAGDAITSSSLPGFGMKAEKIGQVVGRAIESNTYWNEQNCPLVSSMETISWPEDDGTNPQKPCFRLSDGTYVGKIMIYVNSSWYDPDVNLTSIKGFTLNFDTLRDSANNLITRIGAFAEIITGKIKAGVIETRKLVVNGVDVLERLNTHQDKINQLTETIEKQQQEIKALKTKVDALSR